MGIGNYFMNTNVDLFHDSTKNSSGILTSESNEMGLSTIFNYNGNNVAFIKTSYGILINATDMARPYNKRPVDYLRQIYVNELVSTIVSQTHISEDQLVIKMRGSSENGGGTWLYEDVAIDFAQWLDVKFKVWCNSKIKELLTTGFSEYSYTVNIIVATISVLVLHNAFICILIKMSFTDIEMLKMIIRNMLQYWFILYDIKQT